MKKFSNLDSLMIKKIIGGFFASLFVFSFVSANLTISPLKFEYNLNPGTEITDKIKITNNTGNPITLYSSKEDFIAGDDSGTPKFVKPQDQTNDSLSLSEWIAIDAENITLANNESREVTFRVKVPSDGEPGGHYGAVFFSSGVPESGQVAVVQRMGVLLLVNVAGEVNLAGEMKDWNIGTIDGNNVKSVDKLSTFPIGFSVNFENQGNVHIKPTGKILLFDDKGNKINQVGVKDILTPSGVKTGEEIVDYLPINNENGNVLPNSNRRFMVEWKGFAQKSFDKIKFYDFQQIADQKAQEESKMLRPWERIVQSNVTKTYKAQISLNYTGKDGKLKEFNGEKEFKVSYKESKVVMNIYIVILGIILLVFGVYYFTIGKKKAEEKLKAKLLQEMRKSKEL